MRIGVIGFLSALLLGSSAVQAAPAEVKIETGTLIGEAENGVISYKGIPYAAPPIGDLRWKPPTPARSWNGKREAKNFGASCVQPVPRGADANSDFSAGRISEDCLTLNVWMPEKRSKLLPVMVYIHGGAHVIGSSAQSIYDGANFARRDVLIVTINFRLGNLGYFAHPALTKEASPDAPLGNYGMMDQIAALKWVKRNIASFGGDPSNVTVFGESAGGTNIVELLAMPASKGLFDKAIVQSASRWLVLPTLERKEAIGAKLASKWGLDGANATAAELRALPAEKLGVEGASPNFGPFIDGRLLPEAPLQSLVAGRFNDVPLVIGYNSDEGSLMELFKLSTETIFGAYTPEKLAEVRKLYADEATDDRLLARRIFRDALFGVSSRLVAKHKGRSPTWRYYFSYVGEKERADSLGAPHAGDLIYVFNNFGTVPEALGGKGGPTDEDRYMAETIQACWVSFARTGTLQCPGVPEWPAYSRAKEEMLELGDPILVRTHFRSLKIDFQEQNFDPAALSKH